MRIVSWNMNRCMRSDEERREAWVFLRDGLRADLALVQEASPPAELKSVYRAIDETNSRYRWGSAVVALSPGLVLRERPRIPLADCYLHALTGDALPDSHPGGCAVADVVDATGEVRFTAVSFYGQWETMPDGSIYSCSRVHRMLSDLTAVLSASRRRPVILAGDFNLTTQVASFNQRQAETDAAAVVFARLSAWGMTECIARTRASRPLLAGCSCGEEGCGHVQTFRLQNRPDSRPTQLDYAFASENLIASLKTCHVVHDERAWQLSDHCPIVLDFDLG